MTNYSALILGCLFIAAGLWVASVMRRTRPDTHVPWGYGAYYGGPDFGIPPNWPRRDYDRNSSTPSSIGERRSASKSKG
jgi:hypothetical protein